MKLPLTDCYYYFLNEVQYSKRELKAVIDAVIGKDSQPTYLAPKIGPAGMLLSSYTPKKGESFFSGIDGRWMGGILEL